MVKKVDIYGKQEKKVYVEFSNERLAALGITPLMIGESLRNQNAIEAGGQIDTSSDRLMVRVSGQFKSLDDIRNVPISAGGRVIKLGDFTTISRGYEDPPLYTIRHKRPAGADARHRDDRRRQHRRARQDAGGTIAKVQAELPYGVELERVADQPTVVSESVWEFERSLLEALTIVLVVSLLSLGWRTGIVVGPFGADRARRRRARDARHGLEPGARVARLADHRARPARRRRDHRRRDDGR
jgi:multidrug efflux pump subunit AcrB